MADEKQMTRRSVLATAGVAGLGAMASEAHGAQGGGGPITRAKDIDKTAIGPFRRYCDGYARPGAQGLGYVSVLKLATGVVAKPLDTVLDGIVAYDRAEANTAYIGQINMETASSFCGITGQVWGYDLAVADEIKNGTQQPLFTVKQKDPQRTPLPVYDAKPLLDAGIALFGTEAKRRFPPAPGAHVICANKSITVSGGPPTLPDGSPDPHGVQNFAVWCYIALSIAKDRDNSADLFTEDAGTWIVNDNQQDLKDYLDKHRRAVVESIVLCGQDQSVVYDRTYISYAYTVIGRGQIGTALTCAPYVVIAKDAVPGGNFSALNSMTLSEWEKTVGF